MANYLIMAVLALTVAPIVFSILLGLIRGSRRSLLRLILVLLCAVLAFVLCGVVAEKALKTDVSAVVNGEEVGTMTLEEYIQQMLGEDMQDMSEFIVPIVQSIVKVVMFLVLFELFKLLTWIIVYPLCKLFVKPKRVTDSDGHTRKKKRRLIGAVVGLVQGVVVALCICIIVNGFIGISYELTTAMNEMSEMSGESGNGGEEVAMLSDEGDEGAQEGSILDSVDLKTMISEYNESIFGKMYNAIGTKPFTLISSVKVSDDKTITLTGQVEALGGLVKIAKEFTAITELNFENFYADDNITKLTNILDNVQGIKDALSDEARDTVNSLITTAGKSLGIDTSILDKFMTVDLSKEAEAFKKLAEYKDKDLSELTIEDAEAIVSALGNSDLMLDMLAEQGGIDLGNGLSDEQRDKIDEALEELVSKGEITQENMEKIRDIFKLDDVDSNGGELPEIEDTLGYARFNVAYAR